MNLVKFQYHDSMREPAGRISHVNDAKDGQIDLHIFHVRRLIHRFGPPREKTLEVSCGNGEILSRLQDEGYAMRGTNFTGYPDEVDSVPIDSGIDFLQDSPYANAITPAVPLHQRRASLNRGPKKPAPRDDTEPDGETAGMVGTRASPPAASDLRSDIVSGHRSGRATDPPAVTLDRP